MGKFAAQLKLGRPVEGIRRLTLLAWCVLPTLSLLNRSSQRGKQLKPLSPPRIRNLRR